MSLKKSDQKLLFVLLVAIIVSYVYFHLVNLRYSSVTTFDECVTAGFPVLTKYPEECKMPGKIFINPRQEKSEKQAVLSESAATQDFNNISYIFEGQSVVFNQGEGSTSPDNLSTKEPLTFQIVASSSISADITEDLENDTVFLLQSLSPKGQSIYYLAAALKLYGGYTGSNIIYVGVSSSSPSLVYKNGGIVVKTSSIQKIFNFENNLLVEKK